MKRILVSLSLLVPACGDDDHGHSFPECEEIAEACHEADTGSGLGHDCHELAHDAESADVCTAAREECLAFCEAFLAHTVFVAHEGSLVSYDLASGEERPGTVTDVTGPVDLICLADGHLTVNLTGNNEVLAIDGRDMLESARIPSSATTGTRPVHAYLSPERDGAQYLVSLNDGDGSAASNSARFIDADPSSARFLMPVGEVALGIGHHKAAFSSTKERVVVSSIGDCANVLSVYDYGDPENITTLATLDGAAAGFDAADPGEGMFDPTFCDPTYQRGLPPAPHGCATSKISGHAYCNLTSSGAVVVVDLDAETPTFQLLPTSGSGAGYTKAHPDGRYIYTLLESPREGDMFDPGADCQIGALAVIDAMTDTVVEEVPLLYEGPTCTTKLVGTPQETANPGHMQITLDGATLFVGTAGGFDVAEARVSRVLVVDLADPAAPVQQASITTGESTSHVGDTLTGDGKFLLTADNVAGTVTVIDTASKAVVRTITTGAMPKTVCTYGSQEGPSYQTGPIH